MHSLKSSAVDSLTATATECDSSALDDAVSFWSERAEDRNTASSAMRRHRPSPKRRRRVLWQIERGQNRVDYLVPRCSVTVWSSVWDSIAGDVAESVQSARSDAVWVSGGAPLR